MIDINLSLLSYAPNCLASYIQDNGKGVLDQTIVFEKNNTKISLGTKIKTDLVRNVVVMNNGNWIYQLRKCRCQLS